MGEREVSWEELRRRQRAISIEGLWSRRGWTEYKYQHRINASIFLTFKTERVIIQQKLSRELMDERS